MKLLTKMRLINWHYFQNVTIDFGKVNFLTGENASGKSTLIDAMQVVLLGDTTGRSFNKAANEKSGRTLKSYLRGQIGGDGKSVTYLRNGRFSSYIAMQFHDDYEDSDFTMGIVFDIFDDGSEEHKFFVLDAGFPENNFVLDDVPMSFQTLSTFLNDNYDGKYIFTETNSQYQNLLKKKFGNLSDKYFSLFKKAVSFQPITNIEQFITDYVCDVPSEINIDVMQESIRQYKKLEIEAESMQVKIKKLEDIQEIYNQYDAKRRELTLANYISKRATFQMIQNRIQVFKDDIIASNERLAEIDREVVELEQQSKELTRLKEQYIASKVGNGAYQFTADLENSKLRTKEKIERLENELSNVQNKFSSYINQFSNLAAKVEACFESLKEGEFPNLIESETIIAHCINVKNTAQKLKDVLATKENITPEVIVDFRDAIVSFKNSCMELAVSIRKEHARLVQEINYTRQQQNNSEIGGKLYDYQLVQIRSQLENALSNHYGKKIKVYIYADLVDVKSAKWVKAIEGFIFSQKLNMFVDEEYYEAANRILPEIMRRNHYYRTGLVDSEKLADANFIAERGSLAEEILTDHDGARDYTNFLMGKIYKCNDLKEARERGRGITPTCEGYRNFSSFVIPEGNYKYALLGRQISKESLEQTEKELAEKDLISRTYRQVLELLQQVVSQDVINANELESAKIALNDALNLDGLRRNLKTYEDELAESGSKEISLLDEKINKVNIDLDNIANEIQELIMQKGALTTTIQNIKDEKIPHEENLRETLRKELEEKFDKAFVNEFAAPTFEREENSGDSLARIRERYDETFVKAQNKMNSLHSALIEVRRDYVLSYRLSYDVSSDNNDDFDRDLINIRDVKLPEYREKIQDAYEKASKEFKDHFIHKLNTSINMAISRIEELNEAIRYSQFGEDTYEFRVEPRSEYREYYDMIMDDLLLTSGNDETYIEKYKETMDNLFKAIGDVSNSRDQNSVLEQNVAKFTDYRSYLMFDLLSKKGDRVNSLSYMINQASGGETQTPFYISILASFSQLYRINSPRATSNCTRLVIFDEAFSKMDSARIVEAISILEKFGLQVILSAPPDKVQHISKIADETLVVTRHNNRSQVGKFEVRV